MMSVILESSAWCLALISKSDSCGGWYLYWTGNSFYWTLKKPWGSQCESLKRHKPRSGRHQSSCSSCCSQCKPEASKLFLTKGSGGTMLGLCECFSLQPNPAISPWCCSRSHHPLYLFGHVLQARNNLSQTAEFELYPPEGVGEQTGFW